MNQNRPKTFEAYLDAHNVSEDADFFEMCAIMDKWKRYERMERKRREANIRKGQRVLPRLHRASDFDIWKHAEISVGGNEERIMLVKALYRRKARLVNVLSDLYNYLMFDYVRSPVPIYPMTFIGLRKQYNRDLARALRRKEKEGRF